MRSSRRTGYPTESSSRHRGRAGARALRPRSGITPEPTALAMRLKIVEAGNHTHFGRIQERGTLFAALFKVPKSTTSERKSMTRVLMIDGNRALTESVSLQCLEHGMAVRMTDN